MRSHAQFYVVFEGGRGYFLRNRKSLGHIKEILTIVSAKFAYQPMGQIMTIADVSLLSKLKTKMRWHNQRQTVLAENVANADTPGFKGRDLKEPVFSVPTAFAPVKTQLGHVSSFDEGTPDMRARKAASFETTPRGNSVVLEDEMIRVAQNQMDYQAAASVYQKGLGLMRIAIGKRA